MLIIMTLKDLKDPAGSPESADSRELWDAWDGFFAAVRRARGRSARQQGNELTLSQTHLLAVLADEPRARIGELAEAAGVATPTATRMVDSLERAGVVTRDRSEEDRRVVEVRLTPKGKRLLARKNEVRQAQRERFEASLTAGEREQAQALLKRLSEALDEL